MAFRRHTGSLSRCIHLLPSGCNLSTARRDESSVSSKQLCLKDAICKNPRNLCLSRHWRDVRDDRVKVAAEVSAAATSRTGVGLRKDLSSEIQLTMADPDPLGRALMESMRGLLGVDFRSPEVCRGTEGGEPLVRRLKLILVIVSRTASPQQAALQAKGLQQTRTQTPSWWVNSKPAHRCRLLLRLLAQFTSFYVTGGRARRRGN